MHLSALLCPSLQEFEREKHAHGLLRFQLEEMKAALQQREEMLQVGSWPCVSGVCVCVCVREREKERERERERDLGAFGWFITKVTGLLENWAPRLILLVTFHGKRALVMGDVLGFLGGPRVSRGPNRRAVSYTHLTLPTNNPWCRSRWSPYH